MDSQHLMTMFRDELSKQISDLKKDLDSKFADQINVIKSNLHSLHSSHNILESRVDKVERLLHMTDLMIYGIPKSPNEDLHHIFEKICGSIGYVQKDFTLQAIFRINNTKNSTKSKFAPIIAKFISASAKSDFYVRYIKFKILNLSHIGFKSDDRIFVQESLSSIHAEIFRLAMQHKKNNNISSVYTHNGFVCVKLSRESDAIRISSKAHLQQLVPALPEKFIDNDNTNNKRKFNNSVEIVEDKPSSSNVNEAKLFKSTTAVHSAVQLSSPLSQSMASGNKSNEIRPRPRHGSTGSIGTLDGYILKPPLNSMDMSANNVIDLQSNLAKEIENDNFSGNKKV